jgi:hypothetical protein
MAVPKIDEYERRLVDVFKDDDPQLMARVIRMCVLFEDLRVEYEGAVRSEPIQSLDLASKNFRQLYFIRRSLVSMIEFSGAISRLNTLKSWKAVVDEMDPSTRKAWNQAVTYFNDNHKRWEEIRGDMGGHFKEATAEFVLAKLPATSTGKMIIRSFPAEEKASPVLEFTTEFVSIALRKSMTNENPTPEEHRAFINETFTILTIGWRHAVQAVFALVGEFLYVKFVSAPAVNNPAL